jgi:hypothetical protein
MAARLFQKDFFFENDSWNLLSGDNREIYLLVLFINNNCMYFVDNSEGSCNFGILSTKNIYLEQTLIKFHIASFEWWKRDCNIINIFQTHKETKSDSLPIY